MHSIALVFNGKSAPNADAPSPEQLLNVVLDLSPNCVGGEVTADRKRLKIMSINVGSRTYFVHARLTLKLSCKNSVVV